MIEPPVRAGQRLEVAVEDIAFGGEGVSRVEDFVIFTPFVAPGERAEVEIVELKRRFARARLLKVLEPSPSRVPAPCPYFGRCGGCQYQHLDYPTQLQIKHRQVSALFERIGRLEPGLIAPVVPCPQPYHYRNRIMVRSQWDKFKQGLNIGFLRHDNRLVEDIAFCHIAEPPLNRELEKLRRHPPHKGGIKVVLRMAVEGWEVPRDSFFQNNTFALPGLVQAVRSRLQSSGSSYLIDAYCGVGFFSIETAPDVRGFAGVEVDARAVAAARLNAARRNIAHGEYLEGRTELLLPDLLRRFPAESTTLLLDPPRTGCPADSLEMLLQARLRQVLYVSCHPATLARDLNILTRTGVYEVAQVVPVDLFPQTQHIECVADLRLKSAATPN